jgi:hypothetical protein
MAAARQGQRINHSVPAQKRLRGPLKLRIEEAEIECRVMHYQHRAFDEGQQLVGNLGEARLVAKEIGGEAVHVVGLLRHVALGIHMAMPSAARRNAIDEFDAADLDDAMTVERIKSRRFCVENDLAQSSSLPAR